MKSGAALTGSAPALFFWRKRFLSDETQASERQREANRRNGRKGGPKTADGKHRSRLNSLKHGLTSSTLVVLTEEDRQECDEDLRGIRE